MVRFSWGLALSLALVMSASGQEADTNGTVAASDLGTAAASIDLAAIHAMVLPGSIGVAILDLKRLQASTRMQDLWRAMNDAEPEIKTQLGQLEAGLGLSLGRDLDAIVLSFSAKSAVIALVGRLPRDKIVEAARSENLTVTQDSAAPVPLYLAKPETGEAVCLAFLRNAMLFGPEEGVREVVGGSGLREVLKLAGASGGHLLSVAVTGLDKLSASPDRATPAVSEDPSTAAMQKLSSFSAHLDFDQTIQFSARLGFSAADAASTIQSTLQTSLDAAKSAEDAKARELAKNISSTLDGSVVAARLELPTAQTGRIVRDAEREMTAKDYVHKETGLKLRLSSVPYRWELQPSQDVYGSFYRAPIGKAEGFLRVRLFDISKELGVWTLEKEAETRLKQVTGDQTLLSSTFGEIGGNRYHCFDVKQEATIHRYIQFARGDQLWLLIGSTRETAKIRFREEMDWILSQILEAPSAETSEIESIARSQADYLKLMANLNRQQQHFQVMSNILQMQHQTSMTIINNMNSGSRFEYRYR